MQRWCGYVVRLGKGEPAFVEIVRVRGERFLDPLADLFAARAERDDTRNVRKVRAPATISLLIDHDVLTHRRCSSLLARRMLRSVPGERSRCFFPATTSRWGR